jgi:hypothetical protein
MRLFRVLDLREAYRWAAAGGQSLHLHPFAGANSPAPFRQARAAGDMIAHLIDWDRERLCRTARAFGVKSVYIHHGNSPRQHVDLCGRALKAALLCCPSDDNPESEAWAYYFRVYFGRRPADTQLGSDWAFVPKSWKGRGWVWSEYSDALSALPDRLFAGVKAAPGQKSRRFECRNGSLDAMAFADKPAAYAALTHAMKINMFLWQITIN